MLAHRPYGDLLRDWRQRRRLSQLGLALEAAVSAKHLSFVETGRAQPSREMVLRLAQRLDVPLRERNHMLMAAGFAPLYQERPLQDPALAGARAAVQRLLAAHEPYPALAIDRHWNMVLANRMVAPLLAGVPAEHLAPPVNVLRLSIHPGAIGSRILNYDAVRAHLLQRLARQVDLSGDATLAALLDELRACARPAQSRGGDDDELPEAGQVLLPLEIDLGDHTLSLISTTTIFGSPVDVTLSELAIEAFFPADEATGRALEAMAAQSR